MFSFSFGPKSVNVIKAHEQLGAPKHCLLDVRTKDEVRAAGIPGALNIPLDQLSHRADELRSYASIHVICRSGGRSSMGTDLLHSLGLSQAENVTGGILAWKAAGLPLK